MSRIFFTAIVIGGLVMSSVSFGYSGGSGTPEQPYQIATKVDLLELADTVEDYNKCFILTADIDIEDEVFTTAIVGAEDFTGTFDGNNLKITNFTIDGGSNYNIGLFGRVAYAGSVKNLSIESYTVSGHKFIGGLVGRNYGNISNCHSKGSVSGTDTCVGELVGQNYEGTIINCCSSGTVNSFSSMGSAGGLVGYNKGYLTDCFSISEVNGVSAVGGLAGTNYKIGTIANSCSTGTVSGDTCVGGLVGSNWYGASISNSYSEGTVSGTSGVGGLVGGNSVNGSISYCYSTGSVTGTSNVGGLVGSMGYEYAATISNCYSTGTVSGDSGAGGLVGSIHSYGSIINCYSTGNVSGNASVGGLVGQNYGGISSCYFLDTSGPDNGYGQLLTDEQMKHQASFIVWDFIEIWNIGENQTYPFLRTYLPSDINKDNETNFYDLAILASHWLQYE